MKIENRKLCVEIGLGKECLSHGWSLTFYFNIEIEFKIDYCIAVKIGEMYGLNIKQQRILSIGLIMLTTMTVLHYKAYIRKRVLLC